MDSECEDEDGFSCEDWNKPVELSNQAHQMKQEEANPEFCADKFFTPQKNIGDEKPHDSHQRTIIHIDVDCFYAQVEMIRNPALRDKPLGIQQKYLVVTCNYVARKYGVTKLMGIKEAKEKCPQLVLVSGEDLTNYREISYKISEFLQKYTPYVERLGMDENYLDVSSIIDGKCSSKNETKVAGHIYGATKTNGDLDVCGCGCYERLVAGSHIASDIRDALHREVGVTCCAGISYNKLLAKLAGEQHKPNQQTTLFPHSTEEFMMKLPKTSKITGIGWTTTKKLAEMGVVSVVDLQQCPTEELRKEFGENQAQNMKQLCFGVDRSLVHTYSKPQTISDEDSFKKCCTEKETRTKVRELLNSLLTRIEEDGRIAQTLRLTIRKLSAANKYTNRESRQCPIPNHVVSKLSAENREHTLQKLEDMSMLLFTKLVDVKKPFHLTLINIAFCNLVEKTKNSISHFFSPKKHTNEGLECIDPRNVSRDSALLTDASKSSLTENTLNINTRNCKTEDDYISEKERLSHKDTLDKQNLLTNSLTMNCRSNQNSQKRKSSETEVFNKRLRKFCGTESSVIHHKERANSFETPSGSSDRTLEIDHEVLSQLPDDIRKEVLGNNYSTFKPINILSANKPSSNNHLEEVNSFQARTNSNKLEMDVPSGLDRDVFLGLPEDIRKELIAEEQAKSDWAHLRQTKKNKSKNTGPQNILNYFTKKNKAVFISDFICYCLLRSSNTAPDSHST